MGTMEICYFDYLYPILEGSFSWWDMNIKECYKVTIKWYLSFDVSYVRDEEKL